MNGTGIVFADIPRMARITLPQCAVSASSARQSGSLCRRFLCTVSTDIPQIPGLLSVIFCLIEAHRKEIRSQLPLFEAKSSGCPPRSAGTRCFAFIKAHLCRRRLPHLTPICRGVPGVTVRLMSDGELTRLEGWKCCEIWISGD